MEENGAKKVREKLFENKMRKHTRMEGSEGGQILMGTNISELKLQKNKSKDWKGGGGKDR